MSSNVIFFAQVPTPQTSAAPAPGAAPSPTAAPTQTSVSVATPGNNVQARTTTTQPSNAKKQQEAESPGFFGAFGGMLPMILVIVVMFYLMYRSQKKERKKREEMVNSLKKGDKILTVGGIYGTISEVREGSLKIKIAENTEIEIAQAAVGQVVLPTAPATQATTEAYKK